MNTYKSPLAMYPYSSPLLPVVNHFERLQEEYYIHKLISLPGLGLNGRDASFACNHPEMNMVVTDSLEIKDLSWSTLLLTNLPGESPVKVAHILDVMGRTLSIGKSVIYCDASRDDIPNKVWAIKEKYIDKLLIYFEDFTPSRGSIFTGTYNQINAPIVLVGGLVESGDSLEILLNLATHFTDHGIHPTVITKHSIGQFFGFHTIKHILNQPGVTESQKIENLNMFIASLELEEMSNVILVEAPDAVMRFSDSAPNGFGILTYMLTQALRIDSFVCCVPFELVDSQFLKMLSRDFSIRLGSPIDAVHVSNVIVDSARVLETHKISYVHTALDRVHKHIANKFNNPSIPLFDVVSNGGEDLFQFLCGLLNLQL